MSTEESGRKFPLSVILLTKNEEANIQPCLEWLTWADDVILVDSISTDQTTVRASAIRGDIRIFSNEFSDFGQQRNWALDHTRPRYDWILFVDADERITPSCATAIQAAVENPGDKVGFFLCYKNFFLDRWMKHCSLYPSWQLRLLKKGHVRYVKEGHGQKEIADGSLGYIPEPYHHYICSKGLYEWEERQQRYEAEEVELLRRLGREPLKIADVFGTPVARRRFLKRWLTRAPSLRPWLRYLYTYVLRAGFLDGKPGWIYCKLYLARELAISRKLTRSPTV
jgi:glycosyltransferase involved in cell wall biosynthesis